MMVPDRVHRLFSTGSQVRIKLRSDTRMVIAEKLKEDSTAMQLGRRMRMNNKANDPGCGRPEAVARKDGSKELFGYQTMFRAIIRQSQAINYKLHA